MSLKARIVLALALVAALVGAVSAGGSYVSTARQARSNVDELLLTRARAADGIAERGRGGGFPLGNSCPLPGTVQPVAAIQVIQRDGTVTACLGGAVELPVSAADLALAGGGGRDYVLRTVRVDGSRYRVLSVPWRDGRVLQIARDLDEAAGVLDGLKNRLVALTLFGIALAAAAGWLIARRIVRPITDLRDVAESIARSQDLTTPIPGRGDDEVGSLATSFTTMVTALATSREQQQRLIADASHEMRTPLTSLRTNIEMLEHFERLGPDDRRDTLEAVQVDVSELTNLLTELVELATDRAGDEEPIEVVELQPLAAELAGRASRRSGREITVVADAAPGTVRGRPRMLERAISNLIDNAVKYSPAGTPIEVRVRAHGLEVRDRGPGISATDLPHVFERFYRATAARSESGSGLGLAIVDQIVARHGGTTWARNRPDGGAVVGFDLPAR